MYCLCPMWLARVITLVLVLRHSNENHSKQELPIPCDATSATLFPCCPAINPKIENIAKPANTLVAQFVIEIIRESLYKIENSDKKMSILFDSFLKGRVKTAKAALTSEYYCSCYYSWRMSGWHPFPLLRSTEPGPLHQSTPSKTKQLIH